jgi:hypothetical protein
MCLPDDRTEKKEKTVSASVLMERIYYFSDPLGQEFILEDLLNSYVR